MIPNPFIHLLERPIATLTIFGYAILMLVIVVNGGAYVLRDGAILFLTAQRPHRMGRGEYDEWWGDWGGGFVPPASWTIRAMKVGSVLVLIAWALATVVYILA